MVSDNYAFYSQSKIQSTNRLLASDAGHTAAEFAKGDKKFTHKPLLVQANLWHAWQALLAFCESKREGLNKYPSHYTTSFFCCTKFDYPQLPFLGSQSSPSIALSMPAKISVRESTPINALVLLSTMYILCTWSVPNNDNTSPSVASDSQETNPLLP